MRPDSVWRRKRDLNPRAGYPTYSLSRGAPSPLGYFSKGKFIYQTMKFYKQNHRFKAQSALKMWRRGRDSNSWSLARSLVFKTSSINHSDTSPQVPQCNDNDYNGFSSNCQQFFPSFFKKYIAVKKLSISCGFLYNKCQTSVRFL